MDHKSFSELCEIINCHSQEEINIGTTFEALRLFCAKAISDLLERKKQFSKRKLIELFGTVILSSLALSLADSVAVGDQIKIVEKIKNQVNPKILREAQEGIKN